MTNNDPYSTGPAVWDKIEEKTNINREASKALIYAMICGGPVVHICKNFNLELSDILDIRMVFDDIMAGRQEI